MATKSRFTAVVLAVLVISTTLCETTLAQKPPKQPQPPFPVKFRIRFVRHPDGYSSPVTSRLDRINNAGIAIGSAYRRSGYLFDAEAGITCWNVRDLIPEDDLERVPEDAIFSVSGISNSGLVTGTMWWSDFTMGWAYVLDTQNTLNQAGRSFRLVDNTQLPYADLTRGYTVNDWGDVLGYYRDAEFGTRHLFTHYSDPRLMPHSFDYLPARTSTDERAYPELNNRGQVVAQLTVGGAFRYTPGDVPTVEFFPDIEENLESVSGLNDDGVFCGMIYSGKPNLRRLTPYRCDDTGGADAPTPIPFGNNEQKYFSPVRINSEGDLLVHALEPSVSHADTQYLFPIESRIDVSDLSAEELALWKSRETMQVRHMTDRYPVPGDRRSLGRLCGGITCYVGHWKDPDSYRNVGFVLTPLYE